jgi:hypothetical protein
VGYSQAAGVAGENLAPRHGLENFEVEHEFREVGPKVVSMNARRIYDREKREPVSD